MWTPGIRIPYMCVCGIQMLGTAKTFSKISNFLPKHKHHLTPFENSPTLTSPPFENSPALPSPSLATIYLPLATQTLHSL